MGDDYNVLTATSGREGLALLDANEVSLIISDQRMPVMTGSEFLTHAKQKTPDTVRIMLTGYSDINATMEAINKGEVYKYITKPWSDEDLKLTVKEALERFSLVKENQRLTAELKEWNAKLEQRVKEQTVDIRKRNKALLLLNDRLKKNFQASLEAFASLIEMRNKRFSNHSHNVGALAQKIAEAMQLPDKEIETIRAAALLHDIGKIGISDNIIMKNAKNLNPSERREMEQHPIRGQAAIEPIESLQDAGVIVRHHHEWYNGNGYPDGLKFNQIPLGSRIIAVADAIDRLANPGQAGGRYDFKRAYRIAKADKGVKYDGKVLDVAAKVIEELHGSVYRNIGSEEDEYLPGDLCPEMTLSRDVRSGTGVLILPQGFELTMEKIECLKRLHKVDPGKGGIFVYKKK